MQDAALKEIPDGYQKKFIHIDMDSFFVSVELLDAPHLRSCPVAVGGTAAERGVISTANYIARQYGVKSGIATATAYRLCPELVLLPVRFEAYEAVTRKLDSIFRRYTDKIEFLSLDEASLDVSGQTQFNGSATYMAAHIRKAIEQELHLTASAGVAPLKYLAKIASEVNKPDGMFVIRPPEVKEFLAELDIRKIPGVGPKTYSVLENLGCSRCGDVTEDKIPSLMRNLGVHGFYVWERCQGVEEKEEKESDVKSLGVEKTLPIDCNDFPSCSKELFDLLKNLENRLPEINDNSFIVKNLVKLKFSDFSTSSAEAPATRICQDTVISLCRTLWDTKRKGRPVRLIGLSIKVKRKANDSQQMELPW
ncbi:DNA polymerase IV [Pseudomonas sp. LS1212]|uniref:DNA polymerase IV n=1 Tax=Pseudomonas sp. LS1212 TaxID=2972478 RepID=UPI00215BA2E1|nr:DNA polymerase IV [Pseudomonas sp. LS1212]UVJ45234.1 DNA polymerase IV [Pseudomonas sp. LS1212]